MTIGQRIAQLRKEHNFSQEALGEQLGVSRQSIYKWESDSALPEIDKLISLSRLFGVSVGWLLGVEEAPSEEAPAQETGQLTDAQLKMVQEITDRYIAAQPKPQPRKKWPWVLAALVLIFVCFNLFSRLKELNRQYSSLQNSVSRIDQNVSYQIYGISSRVEEILKQQNNLTAEYGVEHHSDDYVSNTTLFSVWAMPKTYVDGMSAVFTVDNGKETIEISAKELPERKFSAEIATELTDMISISVVFTYPDGTRQTQLLDTYESLYSDSMPSGEVEDSFMYAPLSKSSPGMFQIPTSSMDGPIQYVYLRANRKADLIADIRVGLFKNARLVAWAEPCDRPDSFHSFDEYLFFRLPELSVSLTSADELRCGAIVTDSYGRTTVFPGMAYTVDETRSALTWVDNQNWDTDPANWHYE